MPNYIRNCPVACAVSLFKALRTPLPANPLQEHTSQYIIQTMNKRNQETDAICESFVLFLF